MPLATTRVALNHKNRRGKMGGHVEADYVMNEDGSTAKGSGSTITRTARHKPSNLRRKQLCFPKKIKSNIQSSKKL